MIPDFQSIMLPFLQAIADGNVKLMKDITAQLADQFQLSEHERQQLLPSGQQTLFTNRVAWAKTHLKYAGLVDNPNRGKVSLSDLGKQVLATKPSTVDMKFLRQFPPYLEFTKKSPAADDGETDGTPVETVAEHKTPLELLDASFKTLRTATANDLLARLASCSPAFFERVVVKLLIAMGYGGVAGEGTVTGKSHDGGIDGIIKEDKLGLDVVCIQAKRWEGPVRRPVVQAFVGSMDYVRAKKGVIITTSYFTKDALEYVDRIEGKKVVLIDGDRLAALMIEHNVGVTTTKTYELKEVSNDFFDEDQG